MPSKPSAARLNEDNMSTVLELMVYFMFQGRKMEVVLKLFTLAADKGAGNGEAETVLG